MHKDSADHESRELLMQARMSALASLQTTCVPARRAHLEQTIAELDGRLNDPLEDVGSTDRALDLSRAR